MNINKFFFSRIKFELFITNLSYLQPYNKLDKIKHEPQTQTQKKKKKKKKTPYIHTYMCVCVCVWRGTG